MTYERFEDLPVWNTAIELALHVDELLERLGRNLTWAKRDQLDRVSLSISNNIAEGFERGNHSRSTEIPVHRARLSRRGAIHGQVS